MRNLSILFVFCVQFITAQNLKTPFELGNGNQSTTYSECISYYEKLDNQFETIKMQKMGLTDSGEPLHIIVYSYDKNFDYNSIKAVDSVVIRYCKSTKI